MALDKARTPPESSQYSAVLSLEVGDSAIDAKDILLLYLIEDIFSFSMTGKIRFIDKIGK